MASKGLSSPMFKNFLTPLIRLPTVRLSNFSITGSSQSKSIPCCEKISLMLESISANGLNDADFIILPNLPKVAPKESKKEKSNASPLVNEENNPTMPLRSPVCRVGA